jgi:hypothetical protein
MNNQAIADTILHQLGWRKFITMTGAKHFIAIEGGLSFQIPRAKDGINNVVVHLNGLDLYDVTFNRVRRIKKEPFIMITEVATASNVYDDMLQPVFTEKTGLYTKLF